MSRYARSEFLGNKKELEIKEGKERLAYNYTKLVDSLGIDSLIAERLVLRVVVPLAYSSARS